jgi:hypothetical protein
VSKHLIVLSVFLSLLVTSAPFASAQRETAKERRVRFSRGQSKATLQGKAKNGVSYIYKVTAQKDQKLEVRLTSDGSLTFSIVPPGTHTLDNAAGVSQWSGSLPESGDYSIVVATNKKEAAKIPYTLEVEIK